MQWSNYKALCDRPDYWSRWMLDQCIELLQLQQRDDLAALLMRGIEAEPLARPADHKGPAAVHMHRLELTLRVRAEICEAIEQADASGLRTEQTAERGLGGFVEAWREFAMYEQ